MFPVALRQFAATAEFWSVYFEEGVFDPPDLSEDADEYGRAVFPFGPTRRLELVFAEWLGRTVADGWFAAAERGIRLVPGPDGNADGMDLAWQDVYHGAPHLLRWEEADLLGRYAVFAGAADAHPTVPFLLLSAFVAPVAGTDARLGRALTASALAATGAFDARQIACRTPASTPVSAATEWRFAEPLGWHLVHTAEYRWEHGDIQIDGTRNPDPRLDPEWGLAFPYREWNEGMAWVAAECRARTSDHPVMRSDTAHALIRAAVAGPDLIAAGALADFLDENEYPHLAISACLRSEDLARVGWALESLGDLPAGEVIGRLVPSDPSHELEQLELRLQFPNAENAYAMLQPLVKVLYAEGIGTCSLLGSWSAFATEAERDLLSDPAANAGDEYLLWARAGLDRVIDAVRRTAAAHGNPPIRLYLKHPGRQDPPFRRLL